MDIRPGNLSSGGDENTPCVLFSSCLRSDKQKDEANAPSQVFYVALLAKRAFLLASLCRFVFVAHV